MFNKTLYADFGIQEICTWVIWEAWHLYAKNQHTKKGGDIKTLEKSFTGTIQSCESIGERWE